MGTRGLPAHVLQVFGPHVERADDPAAPRAAVRRLPSPARRGQGGRHPEGQ